MSGMQLATGGLALVQAIPRVATGIIQTYKLCQEIKEAPTEIIDLVEELKSYESIFVEIETQFHEGSVSDGLQQSFEQSKRAHANLEELAKELRSELESKKGIRRRLAPIQVVLRKSTLERLEKRLARCVRILQLSVNAYQMAMIKLSPDIIARKVASDIMTQFRNPAGPQTSLRVSEIKSEKHEYVEKGPCSVVGPKLPSHRYNSMKYGGLSLEYTNTEGAWQAQLQLPSWLSKSVYEFLSTPAICGWTYSYRVYNIVPYDSKVIKAAQTGDVNGMLELFRERKASPFDKDSEGKSLLYYAAVFVHYDICKKLLNMGLHNLLDERVGPDGTTPLRTVAADCVIETLGSSPRAKDPELERIVELFQSYLQDPEAVSADRLLDFMDENIYDTRKMTVFRILFMPRYYKRPLRDRLEAVRLGVFNILDGNSLRSLLSEDGNMTGPDVSNSTSEKLSLVHSAALALGCRYPEKLVPYKKPWVWIHIYTYEWDEFVTDTITAANPEDLHGIEFVVPWDVYDVPVWRGTPLTSLIGGALCYLSNAVPIYHWDDMFQSCLQQWLALLQATGVDLAKYGQRERQILHNLHENTKGAFDSEAIEYSRCVPRKTMLGSRRPILQRCEDTDPPKGDQYWIPLRIIDIHVGPEPVDWRILWAPEFEHMSSQFWRLVEMEQMAMPGAWVD